jgi:tetratricopeptide (TPR) repeat protein
MLALLQRDGIERAVEDKAARAALAEAEVVGGEPLMLARVILAAALGRRGEFDEAFALLDLAEADGDAWVEATTDAVRATLLGILDRAAMRIVAARAVDRFAALGDRFGESDARTLLAVDAEQRGDLDTAHLHYEQGLRISREFGIGSHEGMFTRACS